MKKRFQRWYEKNEYVCAFMNLLEGLPIEVQCEIAVDIIINASNLIERDYNKIVQEVSAFNPKDYKRWYDKNPNVHLAIESLRDLTEEQRVKIVTEFSNIILDSCNFKLEESEKE